GNQIPSCSASSPGCSGRRPLTACTWATEEAESSRALLAAGCEPSCCKRTTGTASWLATEERTGKDQGCRRCPMYSRWWHLERMRRVSSTASEADQRPDAGGPEPARPALPGFATAPVFGAGAAVTALLIAFSAGYGYHRDELYFIACGRHLAWGYPDQPPFVALMARVASIGQSLYLFRLPAALAHAGLVLLVVLAARRMGGGWFAQAIAAVATAVAPVLLLFGHLLTMNAFEPLAWLGAALVVLAVVDGADARWWVLGGAIIGVGVLDKHS